MSTRNKLTKEEELRMNNQLLRAKIELITGMSMSDSAINPSLPPRIENHFLSNILQMEEARANSRQISVFEYLNKPAFRPEPELNDDELAEELDKAEQLLSSNQIVCDSICGVDDRVFYKFITEELMKEMILNVKVPGMTIVFTYEEFHPNHEYDISKILDDFIRLFTDNRLEDCFLLTDKSLIMTLERLTNFREFFNEIQNILHEVTGFEHDEEKAEIRFRVSFDGIVGSGKSPIHYEGTGKMNFKYEYGFWTVNEIQFPGMGDE